MLKRKEILFDTFLAGLIFLMVLLMLVLNSCKHETDILPAKKPIVVNNGGGLSTCDPDSIYFENQVLPLLISNCAKSNCHSTTDHKEGIILDNYSAIINTGDVEPGNPGNSKIYEVLFETEKLLTSISIKLEEIVINEPASNTPPLEGQGEAGKVLYVWFDAPIGYISATKQWALNNGKDWKPYWYSDDTKLVHFIGKDNIVFHAIIFPVMLKLHGNILPTNVASNEFMNLEGDKMSTSRGWSI